MRVVLLLWELLQVISRLFVPWSMFSRWTGNENLVDKARQYETMKSLNKIFFLEIWIVWDLGGEIKNGLLKMNSTRWIETS